VLKIDVSFPIGQSEITHIPLEKREELYSAGLAIDLSYAVHYTQTIYYQCFVYYFRYYESYRFLLESQFVNHAMLFVQMFDIKI